MSNALATKEVIRDNSESDVIAMPSVNCERGHDDRKDEPDGCLRGASSDETETVYARSDDLWYETGYGVDQVMSRIDAGVQEFKKLVIGPDGKVNTALLPDFDKKNRVEIAIRVVKGGD